MATTVRLDPGLQVVLVQRTGSQSYRKIWVGPEFEDANGKLPTPVAGCDASLQLFVKQGKACASLYIQKMFIDWMAAGGFGRSWVALYKNISENSKRTQTWQWAIRLTRNGGKDTEKYVAYDYNSNMDIRPGVEAFFFLCRDYSGELAHTGPWEQPQVRLEAQPPGSCGVGLYDEPKPQ